MTADLIAKLKDIPVASGYLDDRAIKRILAVLMPQPSKANDPNYYLDSKGKWQAYV